MANQGDAKIGNNKTELEAPNLGRIATAPSQPHSHGGTSNNETPKRVSKQSVGSDRSIEHSPLHHRLAPSTPSGSRLRSVTIGNDIPDDTPAVPKFGDWDDNDPKSAEGFTQLFELARDEKHSGAGKGPHSSRDASYPNGHRQYGKEKSKVCGCFSWCGK